MRIYIHTLVTILALGILPCATLLAQVTKTDYFMQSSNLRNSLNPALKPSQGYLTLPVFPNIGVNVQTNSFNLDNLIYNGPEGKKVTFIHPSVNADDFLSNLSTDNYLATDVNMKLFGLGFFKGNAYWNVDLGVRAHADANIPKSFFGLIKKGFDRDRQTPYDLSDLSVTGNAFVELGVSHSRPITEYLDLGARIKFLGGLADVDFNAKSLNIDAGPEYWSAISHATLKGSAPGIKAEYDSKGYIDGFEFGNFSIPGYGAGLDIGAVYDVKQLLPVLDGFKVSAALNDIGFISWTKNNSIHLTSPKTNITITPSDYPLGNGEDGSSLSDLFDDVFDDIKEAANLTGEENKARTTMLRMTMVTGLEYEIFKNKLSAGLLYSARFGNYYTLSETTVSINGRPCSWISASLSYSFMHSKFDTLGAALHIVPRKGLNIFFASDYVIPHVSPDWVPTTSKALNIQFGMSIPLGGRKN